jgi:hypothetical protein
MLKLVCKILLQFLCLWRLALALSHKCCLFSSSCVTISTSSLASYESCPFVTQVVGTIGDLIVTIWKGVALLPNVPNCCSKIWPTPNGPPNLLICRHNFFKELLDNQVHPLSLPIRLGSEWGVHLDLWLHALPQGLPKLTCELGISIRHNVLGEAMMLEHMHEKQPSRFLGHGTLEKSWNVNA